jgi:hypothetical protein
VKAASFLIWVGGGIAISVTVTWALLYAHNAQPHKDAAHRNDIMRVEKRIELMHNDLKDDITEIRQYIMRDK